MGRFKDLTGKTFGRWKVIERAEYSNDGHIMWLCECQCEKKTLRKVIGKNLVEGKSKSCGCLREEANLKHGSTKTRLYRIWQAMKERTGNYKNSGYKNYGQRGIKVCKEWIESFENFKKWVLDNGYQDNLSIERKNVNGDYCPENCCWATTQEQNYNKTNTHYIEFNNKIQSMAEWAKEFNIPYYVLKGRINRYGWSIEDALTIPPIKYNRKRKNIGD